VTLGNVYTLRYNLWKVADGIEFERDDENRKHLAAHKVTDVEFEQLLLNEPLDLEFDLIDGEERNRSVGVTAAGRMLTVVWTVRKGKIRAITAFSAGVFDRQAFMEKLK
jgi:uncharacterized DUF497 family protein